MVDEFKQLFDLSFDILAVLDMDGKPRNINKAFSQSLGWGIEDLREKSFWRLVKPDVRVDFVNIAQNLSKGHPLIFIESQILCKNGGQRSLCWTAYPDLKHQRVLLIMRESRPKETPEILNLALEASPTVLLVIREGIIQYANRLASLTFGYQNSELIGKPVDELIPLRLRETHKLYREDYGKNPYLRLMGSNLNLVGQRKDGSEMPLDIGLNPVQTSDGMIVVCSVIDLTKAKAAQQDIIDRIKVLENEISVLGQMALTDELTTINNRRGLSGQLELHFRRAQKETQPISFLLMDIDNFKQYNDTHGHIAGDKVLKSIAEIMKKSLRRTEIIARYGGEEFAAILPATNAIEAKLLAERLRKMITAFEWPDSPITVSIGCATLYPRADDTLNPDDIKKFIAMADKALYSSKQSGKNKVTHFNDLNLAADDILSSWVLQHDTPTDR